VTIMRHQFREGDRVRHRSYPAPLRVIGIGTTIAVQFPNGIMQAFEPSELEKVPIAKVPVHKVRVCEYRPDRGLGSAERFTFVTSISLICLIVLVLVVIATVTL
jgi:hypothetical protein